MEARTRSTGRRDRSKFELIARAGYVAKGVVYGTVGLLTLGAIYEWFGNIYSGLGNAEVTGTRGALETIASQPFGNFLLIAMTAGLAGYVVWRLVQAITDAEDKGSDASGLFQRAGFFISGSMYALLALYAAQLAGWLGGGGGDGSSRREWTARLMGHELGIWLVGLVGVAFVGVGIYQCYRSATRKFEKKWQGSNSPWTVRLAQFGVAARGFTLMLIGGIVINAAIQADPDEARGLGHALRSLQDETYGTVLLTVIGAGLICYGLYCFINARYRQIGS